MNLKNCLALRHMSMLVSLARIYLWSLLECHEKGSGKSSIQLWCAVEIDKHEAFSGWWQNDKRRIDACKSLSTGQGAAPPLYEPHKKVNIWCTFHVMSLTRFNSLGIYYICWVFWWLFTYSTYCTGLYRRGSFWPCLRWHYYTNGITAPYLKLSKGEIWELQTTTPGIIAAAAIIGSYFIDCLVSNSLIHTLFSDNLSPLWWQGPPSSGSRESYPVSRVPQLVPLTIDGWRQVV